VKAEDASLPMLFNLTLELNIKKVSSAGKWNLKLLLSEKKGFVSNTDFGCINTVEVMDAWGKA
jgi:hypothetical protein